MTLRVSFTLTALLLSGCAAPEEPAAEPASLSTARQAMVVSDPSTHTSLPGLCKYPRTFNGVSGRIYHAPYSGCGNVRYSPLVVVLPAMGYDVGQYNDLLKHLAKNGFIAVSVDSRDNDAKGKAAIYAAEDAIAFLDGVRTFWEKRNFIDHSNVGLIGHSRGGGSVLDLAQNLEDPSHTWDVRAVMTMAPRYDDLAVDSSMSPALLALQGTDDGDMVPERSFELYDNSGSEGSAFFNGVDRAMKLFHDGNHASFAQPGEFLDSHGEVGFEVTRGYALAFMAHHLQGDSTWYDGYIRGNEQPGAWPYAIDTQFSDGVLRYVVDDGEHATVVPSLENLWASNTNLGNSSYTYHETRAYAVMMTGSVGTMTWTVADQNASYYQALSLRIGQLGTGAVEDVEVSVRNDGRWSTLVRLTDHGRIAELSAMCDFGTGSTQCSAPNVESRRHMATIRVPLTDLGPVDDLERVRLTFSGDAQGQTFYVDSVELAGWAP